MKRSLKFLAVLAPVLAFMPAVAPAQSSNAPVVAVLVFENGSFGKDRQDYDGIGKGIMDLMITDLASGTKVRVVDRERVQNILQEQNLTKAGAIDGATAVRVGKMFGACYSIYGTFMRGTKGENTLTVHTTNNETGQIQNAQKVTKDGDDVMALIAEASTKFANAMDVKACPGAGSTARPGDASPASAPAAASTPAATPVQQSAAKPVAKDAAPKAAPTNTVPGSVNYAKALTAAEKKKLQSNKLDARSMLLYSRALDAQDHNEKAKAVALFQQVKAKFPNFEPAQKGLDALQKSGN